MRKLLGRFIEWLLSYEHTVVMDKDAGALSPFRKYDGDAGYDLFAARDVAICPGQAVDVPAGVRIDPRERLWFEIKARSSTLKKRGLEVVDAVIDRDYRGDLLAVVRNPTGSTVFIKAGERIVQVIPHRLIPVRFVYGELSSSPRGTQGFGSTGS